MMEGWRMKGVPARWRGGLRGGGRVGVMTERKFSSVLCKSR